MTWCGSREPSIACECAECPACLFLTDGGEVKVNEGGFEGGVAEVAGYLFNGDSSF